MTDTPPRTSEVGGEMESDATAEDSGSESERSKDSGYVRIAGLN